MGSFYWDWDEADRLRQPKTSWLAWPGPPPPRGRILSAQVIKDERWFQTVELARDVAALGRRMALSQPVVQWPPKHGEEHKA